MLSRRPAVVQAPGVQPPGVPDSGSYSIAFSIRKAAVSLAISVINFSQAISRLRFSRAFRYAFQIRNAVYWQIGSPDWYFPERNFPAACSNAGCSHRLVCIASRSGARPAGSSCLPGLCQSGSAGFPVDLWYRKPALRPHFLPAGNGLHPRCRSRPFLLTFSCPVSGQRSLFPGMAPAG